MRSAKDTPFNANRSDPRSPEEDLCYLRHLLLIACVFSAVGEYTDAYSYLVHGRVFANAQTGNIIFFAIFASEGQWIAAVGHLPPIMAFALGVAVANLFGVETNKRYGPLATNFCDTPTGQWPMRAPTDAKAEA